MDYASYQFYKDNYKGTLDMSLFLSFITQASHEIDMAVNRTLTEEDITDQVSWVACELVDYLKNTEGSKKNISSVSIDGISKSYVTKDTTQVRSEIARITDRLPQDLIRFL